MDVLLNEEEEMLRKATREFFESECPPKLVRAMETDDLGYPPDLWRKTAEMGFIGLALPKQYGGEGASLLTLGLLLEAVGRAVAPLPLHSTLVAALTIADAGDRQQCQRILPQVSSGNLIMTWAVTERDPRLNPEDVATTAKAEGDHYVISGSKLFVENFNASDQCLVACRTAPGSVVGEGISLFIVDTKSPGVSHVLLPTLGGEKQSRVVFDRVKVPKANLVGGLNKGWPIVERMLERATALICAQIVGASRKAMEMAIDFSKKRIVFGRPLGSFQANQHLCADMVIWVDGTEMLTFEALWRLSEGLPATKEVSTAKAVCNERCQMVLRNANHIHGGIAQIKEFDLNLWFRRASAWMMRFGTTFEHRKIIAKAVLAA
ncbi:MAG: acyl-CoA dehydrogenase [Dehalococcoidia bacterium]|nr:acyl-CoA dehydrogenase [Dehalococcoidia bacterium]